MNIYFWKNSFLSDYFTLLFMSVQKITERLTIKVCDLSSLIESTAACASSDDMDNLKYMNLNFIDHSDTSSQMKGAASDYQKSCYSNYEHEEDEEEYYQQRKMVEEEEPQGTYIPQQDEEDILQQGKELDEAEEADDTDGAKEAEGDKGDRCNLEMDDKYQEEQYQKQKKELYHDLEQEQDQEHNQKLEQDQDRKQDQEQEEGQNQGHGRKLKQEQDQVHDHKQEQRRELDQYDERQRGYTPTTVQPPESEIFSQTSPRSLQCNSDLNDPSTIPSKPLKEIGFTLADIESWEDAQQATKQPLYKLLRRMIDTLIKPNVQIKIGLIHFNCHMIVLQSYSELFMEYGTEVLIQLPEEEVTPSAFMMAYEWMLADTPLIQREGIAELFKAAKFMRIKELVNQCWVCLVDDSVFQEDTAYFLYLEARLCGGLENLEQIMMMRICRFFLTLVASRDFLELEPSEVVKLLSSNCIGVNAEIEVLMSGIRWLNYDWENRKQYVSDVISTVRFGLFPPYILMTLTKSTDCAEVDRVLEYPEVHQMMIDGMAYSTIQHYYAENGDQFSGFMDRHKLTPPMERRAIIEKGACFACNVQHITYDSFLDYLNMIQSMGTSYWQNLELRKVVEKGKCSCTSTEGAALHPLPPPPPPLGKIP